MKNTATLLLIVLVVSFIGLQSVMAAKNGPPSGVISEVYFLGFALFGDLSETSGNPPEGVIDPNCDNYTYDGGVPVGLDPSNKCILTTTASAATSFCALTGFEYIDASRDDFGSGSCVAEISDDGTYRFVMTWNEAQFEPNYGWCEFRCLEW